VNARGATRLGLLTLGLALSAAVACDAQELLPVTHTVVTAASSIESTALLLRSTWAAAANESAGRTAVAQGEGQLVVN
jgi:hypothetical protein